MEGELRPLKNQRMVHTTQLPLSKSPQLDQYLCRDKQKRIGRFELDDNGIERL